MKPKEALDHLTDKLLAYGPSKGKGKKAKPKAKKKKAPLTSILSQGAAILSRARNALSTYPSPAGRWARLKRRLLRAAFCFCARSLIRGPNLRLFRGYFADENPAELPFKGILRPYFAERRAYFAEALFNPLLRATRGVPTSIL